MKIQFTLTLTDESVEALGIPAGGTDGNSIKDYLVQVLSKSIQKAKDEAIDEDEDDEEEEEDEEPVPRHRARKARKPASRRKKVN